MFKNPPLKKVFFKKSLYGEKSSFEGLLVNGSLRRLDDRIFTDSMIRSLQRFDDQVFAEIRQSNLDGWQFEPSMGVFSRDNCVPDW